MRSLKLHAEAAMLETRTNGTETVLLVDDEPAIHKLMCRLLSGRGYTVFEAANGTDALLLAKDSDEPIDLLVTDVLMPGLHGPELAQQMVQSRPDLRVLYTSGYTAEAFNESAPGAPLGPMLKKPFKLDELAETVRATLDASDSTTV